MTFVVRDCIRRPGGYHHNMVVKIGTSEAHVARILEQEGRLIRMDRGEGRYLRGRDLDPSNHRVYVYCSPSSDQNEVEAILKSEFDELSQRIIVLDPRKRRASMSHSL